MRNFNKFNTGIRQCKFKGSQRNQFIDTTRIYLESWKRDPDYAVRALENEVNMHNDAESRAALRRNVLGLVYWRTTGNAYQLEQLRRLAASFKAKGMPLPIFAITNEMPSSLTHWQADISVRLELPPYDLVLLDSA